MRLSDRMAATRGLASTGGLEVISVWTQIDCDVEGCTEHFRERGHKAWSTMMSSELGDEWRSLYSTYTRRFFCPDHRPQYEEAARARDAQVATERYRLVVAHLDDGGTDRLTSSDTKWLIDVGAAVVNDARAANGWRWVKLPWPSQA